MIEGSSELLHKGPCIACDSSDACAVYDDGHGHCFSCGGHFSKEQMEHGAAEGVPAGTRKVPADQDRGGRGEFLSGRIKALNARGLREETCKKYGYAVGTFGREEKPVQIAPYYDAKGNLIAQKLRDADKKFTVLGDGKAIGKCLFGANLWRESGRRIVITEGEIDAMSVAQAMGLTWPAVSVPNGADGAVKSVKANLEWLETYEEVVIWFDNDEPGRKASVAVAELLSPGKAKVVHLEAKDANALLQAGDVKAISTAVWEAKVYRPDGIVSGEEISLDSMLAATPTGYSTPYPGLDRMVGGLRQGELILFTAGTGIGKSTLVRELGYHLNVKHGLTIGNVFLEENQAKTAQGYVALDANIALGRLRAKPDLLTRAQWEKHRKATVANGRNFFYSHFGSLDSDNLLSKLRYLAVSLKANFIVLDHLSIVVSGMESSKEGERKDIDRLVTRLRQLIEQTGVGVLAIAHLSKADGTSHEEGGRVALNDLRGSASLKQLPDTIIALERDQQGDNPLVSTMRVLKNREFGETGVAGEVAYNKETGRLMDATKAALADAF